MRRKRRKWKKIKGIKKRKMNIKLNRKERKRG